MPRFVDHDGEILSCASETNVPHSLPLSRQAQARLLVLERGWVEFAHHGDILYVRLRPRQLAPRTLSGLFYLLGDVRPRWVVAHTFIEGWEFRRFASRQTFMAFCSALHSVPSDRAPERLIRQKVDVGRSCFRDAVATMRIVAANVPEPDGIVAVLTRTRAIRWSVCRVNRERQDSEVLALNECFTPFNEKLARAKSVESLKHYADEEYGRQIAMAHYRALQSGEPLFEHVDAIPRFAGIGDTHLRYEAVSMPIRAADGSDLLLCGSVTDHAINLRYK